MSPNDALRSLAASIQPTALETSVGDRHFRTIATRLEQSFTASRFIRIGSHARGTAIKTFSDIDMLAVLPRDVARWGARLVAPRTFLANIAKDLQDRYTTTAVRRDGQAVVLNFAGGQQSVDVVPGIFEGMNSKRPMYLIPGAQDQWISTSPETHDVLFHNANERSGGKLGGLARLIKAWKYGRDPSIPLASFYTDMLLTSTALAAGVKSYGACLRDFFATLADRNVRGLRDPGGIAGVIVAGPTDNQLNRLYSAAKHAHQHADAALKAELAGNNREANRQWGIVFNRNL